jgi:hypothetical protein
VTSEAGGGQNALRADEREELERLRAEVAELRAGAFASEEGTGDTTAGTGATGGKAEGGRGRGKSAVAVIAILLACVLAPVSVVSVWAKSQVFDTDRYVETVAPLADDPAVQAMVTQRITTEIFSRIDVTQLTSDAVTALQGQLPSGVGQNLQALAPVMADGVQNVVRDQIGNLVATSAFADAWAEANRAAHDELVATLSGQGRALEVQGTTVSVQLATFVNAVKQRLSDRGFTLAERIPDINASFVVLRSPDLPRVQRGFDALNTLGLWLPVLTLALFAIGVFLARDHRRALIGAGLGLALSMLLVGIALALARLAYLDAVPPSDVPPSAAAAIYDTLVRFLREGIRAVGLAALVVAAGAFLLGPSRTATTVRGGATAGSAAASRGLSSMGVRLMPVSQRVSPHSHGLRIGLVVVAFMAFLLPAYPTPALVVWIAVGLLLALLVVQVLSTAPPTSGSAMTAEGGT